MPGVPWSASGALHPQPNGNGKHLTVARDPSQMWGSAGEESYLSRSMGPGLYGDEDINYAPNGYYSEGGTDADGNMTLDMVTEVDETEFDEDVSQFILPFFLRTDASDTVTRRLQRTSTYFHAALNTLQAAFGAGKSTLR